MRRPNICGSSVSIVDPEVYKPATRPHKEPGRVSLVRRMLGGGSKKGKDCPPPTKQFGVAVVDLPLHKSNVPKVLHRMCSYLESNGLGHGNLFKGTSCDGSVVEGLKSEMDREGDAKLEDVESPIIVASLLKTWLNELPEPLLDSDITRELVGVMSKYEGEGDWAERVGEWLPGGPRGASLARVVGLLRSYAERQPASMAYVPSLFAPLLAYVDDGPGRQHTVRLVASLIDKYQLVFRNNVQNKDNQIISSGEGNNLKQAALVISEIAQTQKHRKRKERHDSGPKSDLKFVRSNSEERPALKTACSEMRAETMRRVSSHEDFSKSRVPSQVSTAKAHTPQQVRKSGVLSERNGRSPERSESGAVAYRPGLGGDVLADCESEARRQRFAPRSNRHRRRRPHKYRSSPLAKENEMIKQDEEVEEVLNNENDCQDCQQVVTDTDESLPLFDLDSADADSTTPVTSSSEQSLKLDDLTEEELNKCPSPISGFYSPTLDMRAKHGDDPSSEPVSSAPLWSTIPPSEERMVSPRNSLFMSRRVYSTGPSASSDEVTVLDLNAQIHGLKQKIKKFEETFERESGHKPSQADKAANPEIRKMMSLLSKLRKQARYKKDEARIASMEKSALPEPTEEVVRSIERRLAAQRGTRSSTVELMSAAELAEEKSAMQRALLQLEHAYGRPTTKAARDTVRPLYDRYRLLKRSLVKHTPSKMKESVSELGTILEHETMDFSGIPPSPPRTPSPPPVQPPTERKAIAQTVVLDNLHALPQNELIEVQKATREEKKRLKRTLRELEMGRSGGSRRPSPQNQMPPDSELYADYKQAKAKLKFIDALMNKIKK